jgi:phage-related protein
MTNNVNYTLTLTDLLTGKLKDAETQAGSLDNKMTGLEGMVKKVGLAAGAAFAIDKIASFGGHIVSTLGEFEKYDAVLTNTLGSGSASKKVLENITDFASKTPFQVNELTESYVKLANQGFKPSMEQMTKLGDLASSTGKGFGQLGEAIIDAQTGEFERLKEFGVKASKHGDQVTFAFKGVQTTVSNSSDAIQKYILGLGDMQGVTGAMAAISQTTEGQISNLEDNVTSLYLALGKELKPVISTVISALSGFIDTIKNSITWIKQNKDGVKAVAIGLGIAAVAYGVFTIAANASAIATSVMTSAQWALNAAMNANPIGLIVVGIAALAAGFVYAWQKSVTFRAVLIGVFEVIKEGVNTVITHFKALWDVISGVFTLDAAKIKKGFDAGFENVKNAGSRMGQAFKKGYNGEMAEFAKQQTSDKFTQGFESKLSALQKLSDDGKISAKAYGNAIANLKGELNKGLKGGTIGRDIYDQEWAKLVDMQKIGGPTSPTSPTKPTKDTSPKGASGTKSTTINITIGKLIEEFKVQTTTVGEGASKIKEKVAESLLSAINDSQVVAGI